MILFTLFSTYFPSVARLCNSKKASKEQKIMSQSIGIASIQKSLNHFIDNQFHHHNKEDYLDQGIPSK